MLPRYAEGRIARGRRAVARNSYPPEQEILAGAGPVAVKAPKVPSGKGESVATPVGRPWVC